MNHYFGYFKRPLTVEKATGTFVSVTFLVESAICTLSKILLLTKERASTPVLMLPGETNNNNNNNTAYIALFININCFSSDALYQEKIINYAVYLKAFR